MRSLVCAAVCLAAGVAVASDDERTPAPSRPQASIPSTSPESQIQRDEVVLKQKFAELKKLQGEILQLRGTIDPPLEVKIFVRAVMFDAVKLRKLGLTHPFMADDRDNAKQQSRPLPYSHAQYANDAELLSAIEPLVDNGCAVFAANPIIKTSIGQSATVSCYRECPGNRHDEDQRTTHSSDAIQQIGVDLPEKSPGFCVEISPRSIVEEKIHLDIKGRVNVEQPENAIKLNGHVKTPVESMSMQSSVRLEPGKPYVLGGTRNASFSRVPLAERKRRFGISAFQTDMTPATAERTTDFVWLVTAEIVTKNGESSRHFK